MAKIKNMGMKNMQIIKQQTSVDWILEKIGKHHILEPTLLKNVIEIAKQMEKEQIMKAVDRGFDEGCKHPEDITLKDAEQYYNETFGNK
jgi:hypothetical protein